MRKQSIIWGILPLLAACGGDSSSGSPIQAPAPTPSPSPAPAPTPTPTPTPTAAIDPGGARLAGLAVPGTLSALVICSTADVTLDRGKVAAIAQAGELYRETLDIQVDQDYTYAYDINGFGGPHFTSAARRGGTAYESFVVEAAEAELQIVKTGGLDFATLGLTNYYDLCFLAAAPANAGPPPGNGQRSYDGLVDGLHQDGDDADRLYGSTATLIYQESTRTYAFAMTLRAVENAFAEPAGQAQAAIGTAGATLSLDLATGTFRSATLTAPGGFTGTITGRIGGNLYNAALLTFELTGPAGERMWGVVAADGALI